MKKAQSLLVFFIVQLICIAVFFIVVISLITMSTNVNFSIMEFNQKTENILLNRWLLSSPDCLAYEDIALLVDEGGVDLFRRTFPNIIDVSKIRDYEHVNCIRKEKYDLLFDVDEGVIDAKYGSGAGLKYDIIVFDLSGDEPIALTGPNPGGVTEHTSLKEEITTTSLMGRVSKQPSTRDRDFGICSDIWDDDKDEWITNEEVWDKYTTRCCHFSGAFKQFLASSFEAMACRSIKCPVNPLFIFQWSWTECLMCEYTRALDAVERCTPPTRYEFDCLGNIKNRCTNWRNPFDRHILLDDAKGKEADYVFGSPERVMSDKLTLLELTLLDLRTMIMEERIVEIDEETQELQLKFSTWNHQDLTCFDHNIVDRSFIPVRLYDDGELKNGIIFIQSCIFEGEEYSGFSMGEFKYMSRFRN